MEDHPPKTSVAPFKVLGRVPWGGKSPPNEVQRIAIAPHQHPEVIAACEKLAKTGRIVCARLDRDSSVPVNRDIGLVDLLALEAGIRWYRDNTPGQRESETWKEHRQRQQITPTDVLHYICRSIAWLLRDMGAMDVPSKFPTDYDAMTEKMEEIAEVLRRQSAPQRVAERFSDD